MNSNIFMAFAKGGESTEGTTIKRYTGVAPVKILSSNPNKAELEKLFDTTLENEPEYIGEIESKYNKYIDRWDYIETYNKFYNSIN